MSVPSSIADPKNPNSLSARFRARRSVLLKALLTRLSARTPGPFRILDLGGTPDYWRAIGIDFLDAIDARIAVANLHASELDADIGTDRITTIVGNACAMEMADNSFDFVHSNSVVEHVGHFTDMMAFAREVSRLAPSYYVQTPYYWFPVDPHYHRVPALHWMPVPLQVALLRRFRLGHSAPDRDIAIATGRVESRVILTATQFRYLFPDAQHQWEKVFGLPKSMIAIREDGA